MSTTVWFLLAVCAVASVLHRAPVVSQCTTNHCHDDDDDDKDMGALTALVNRLQDTLERQQDSLEQQQREMITFKETIERQQRETTALNETVEQQRKQNQEERRQLATLNETVVLQEKQLMRLEEKLRDVETLIVHDAHDCADLRSIGMSTSGVYNIRVAGRTVAIWCDLTSEGESWLVFQRRVDNTTDFYRGWKSYKNGFGDLTRNFWLGNDNLHAITAQKKYTLRVDLADFEGHTSYAVYTDFAIANEVNNYTLTLGSYSGTAGDSLSYHGGRAFSTRDRDSDGCAQGNKGAWWYNSCHISNLNGLYLGGANVAPGDGITWREWRGNSYSLKTVAMKIRPQ